MFVCFGVQVFSWRNWGEGEQFSYDATGEAGAGCQHHWKTNVRQQMTRIHILTLKKGKFYYKRECAEKNSQKFLSFLWLITFYAPYCCCSLPHIKWCKYEKCHPQCSSYCWADCLFSCRVTETHALAAANQQKNDRLRAAFGISSDYVDGSSFHADRKEKEKEKREQERLERERQQQQKYMWVG